MLTPRALRQGFTLIEVVVALVILSTAVLGLAATAGRLSTAASSAELRALALESVEDRLARVRLDPRYGLLDSIYTGTETDVLGTETPGYSRKTTISHVQQGNPVSVDYTKILVEVTGPMLSPPIARQITIAAP